MKIGKKGASTGATLGIIASVVLIIGVVYYVGTSQQQATTGPSGYDYYTGLISLSANAINWDTTAARSETSPVYTYHRSEGKSLSNIISASDLGPGISVDGAASVTLGPVDEGRFFLRIYGGTADFLDYPAFKANFPASGVEYVGEKWLDITGDGIEDYLVELFVTLGFSTPDPTTAPPLAITYPLITDDTSFATDSPADQTAKGETQLDSLVTWKITGTAASTGMGIARVYVGTNRSLIDIVTVGRVIVTSYGTSAESWDVPVSTSLNSYYGWYLGAGGVDFNEPKNAVIVGRRQGTVDEVSVSITFTTSFSTNDSVEVTLYFQTLNPNGTVDTVISDTVKLNEA